LGWRNGFGFSKLFGRNKSKDQEEVKSEKDPEPKSSEIQHDGGHKAHSDDDNEDLIDPSPPGDLPSTQLVHSDVGNHDKLKDQAEVDSEQDHFGKDESSPQESGFLEKDHSEPSAAKEDKSNESGGHEPMNTSLQFNPQHARKLIPDKEEELFGEIVQLQQSQHVNRIERDPLKSSPGETILP
jgi:hypothetical protein